MKKILVFAFVAITLASCTQNEMAKNYGGSMTLDLPSGQKLVNITWKDDQIWYLSRPMNAKDSVETYTFQEKSSYGIQEGTITIKESK